MKRNIRHNKGFTLIELLISIFIIITVGSIVASVIASTLRVSNKTDNIENVRRNGDYALSQMAKNIEYTKSFEGLKNNESDPYDMSCVSAIPTTYKYIKITTWDDSLLEYNCASPSPPATTAEFTIARNGGTANSIFDINSVKITNCVITCTQVSIADVPIIGISFALQQIGVNSLAENSSPDVTFETSVIIRNYTK